MTDKKIDRRELLKKVGEAGLIVAVPGVLGAAATKAVVTFGDPTKAAHSGDEVDRLALEATAEKTGLPSEQVAAVLNSFARYKAQFSSETIPITEQEKTDRVWNIGLVGATLGAAGLVGHAGTEAIDKYFARPRKPQTGHAAAEDAKNAQREKEPDQSQGRE